MCEEVQTEKVSEEPKKKSIPEFIGPEPLPDFDEDDE
tara:strand:- start:50 stop:160 length:111 start_codon:yes stop_codon:yes gene_type:complete